MIGIIIVNYNDWNNLKNCIRSIEVDMHYRIYVIDNASKEDLFIEELKAANNVTYIQSNINGGYSRGNNLGLKQALKDGCDFFMISNTDIVFNKYSINNLIVSLQNNECDIVGPKILLPNGSEQEEILGVRVTPFSKIKLIINSATRGLIFKQFKAKFNNLKNLDMDSYQVYGVSGCCFVFNKVAIEMVFPLDENIFLYNEEWLLSEMSFRKNLRTMVNKNSVILHIHGATTKKIKIFSYYCFIKSEFYVINTLFPKFLILNLIILLMRLPKFLFVYFKERIQN